MSWFLLHRLALRLQGLERHAQFVVAIAGALAAWLLIDAPQAHNLPLRVLLIVAMWALLLVSFVRLFLVPPPVVLPALGWVDRWRAKLQRALFTLMRWAFLVIVVLVASLSIKLLLVE